MKYLSILVIIFLSQTIFAQSELQDPNTESLLRRYKQLLASTPAQDTLLDQDKFTISGALSDLSLGNLKSIRGEVIGAGVEITGEQREHIRNHGIMVDPQFDVSGFESICPDAKFTIDRLLLPKIKDGVVLEASAPYLLQAKDVTCRESERLLSDHFLFKEMIERDFSKEDPQAEYKRLIKEYLDTMPGFSRGSAMEQLLRLNEQNSVEQ